MCDIFIYVGFDSSFINHKAHNVFPEKITFTQTAANENQAGILRVHVSFLCQQTTKRENAICFMLCEKVRIII